MAPRPVDDGRNKARRHNGGASDTHFASHGVGEKLDVLHLVAQIVECGHAAIDQGADLGMRSRSLIEES